MPMVSVRAPTLKEALRIARPKVLRWPTDRQAGILLTISWLYVKQEEHFEEPDAQGSQEATGS